jgi:hypothetical protein
MSSQPVGASPEVPRRHVNWRAEGDRAVRTLAEVRVASALSGAIVGGIGGRLAMGLLAAQNSEDHGTLTDDGFVMGQFTLGGTLNLMFVAVLAGLLASLLYVALRGLLIGPLWFQVTTLSIGAGVVVGALLVDPDGVDFTLLDPPLLAIGLFIAIPVLAVAMLALLARRFLRPTSWFATGDPRQIVTVTLALWIIGLPLLLLLAAIVAAWAVWQRVRVTGLAAVAHSPVILWSARGLLAVLFGVAVANLGSDIQTLT